MITWLGNSKNTKWIESRSYISMVTNIHIHYKTDYCFLFGILTLNLLNFLNGIIYPQFLESILPFLGISRRQLKVEQYSARSDCIGVHAGRPGSTMVETFGSSRIRIKLRHSAYIATARLYRKIEQSESCYSFTHTAWYTFFQYVTQIYRSRNHRADKRDVLSATLTPLSWWLI